jgi:hypothetical protein
MDTYKTKRTFIRQIPNGADLYESLTKFVVDEDIKVGRITAIGATMHAVVAYYDQSVREYQKMEFPGGMEILSCSGNVSLRDGKPFAHVHIMLGDRHGKAVGGHLMPGTKVFACEVFIEEYEGEALTRARDELTGLFLWNRPSLI